MAAFPLKAFLTIISYGLILIKWVLKLVALPQYFVSELSVLTFVRLARVQISGGKVSESGPPCWSTRFASRQVVLQMQHQPHVKCRQIPFKNTLINSSGLIEKSCYLPTPSALVNQTVLELPVSSQKKTTALEQRKRDFVKRDMFTEMVIF